MDKKGFTLIELIAAITILGILTVLIAPNVIKMRNNVLEKSLQSKLDMIKTAAKDYASDDESVFRKISSNKCTTTTVGNLIENGYLTGDTKQKTAMSNPLTGKTMNGEQVCIYFDSDDVMTRKITACVIGYDEDCG